MTILIYFRDNATLQSKRDCGLTGALLVSFQFYLIFFVRSQSMDFPLTFTIQETFSEMSPYGFIIARVDPFPSIDSPLQSDLDSVVIGSSGSLLMRKIWTIISASHLEIFLTFLCCSPRIAMEISGPFVSSWTKFLALVTSGLVSRSVLAREWQMIDPSAWQVFNNRANLQEINPVPIY